MTGLTFPAEIEDDVADRLSRTDQVNRGALDQVPREVLDPDDIDLLGTWREVDLAAILAGGMVPPHRVLSRTDGEGLIYAGKLNGFQGPPESAKTWLALLAITEQVHAGNHAVFIDLEDTAETATSRLKDLGLKDEQIIEHVHYVRPEERLSKGAVDHALGFGPTLIVVDSMTELMSRHDLDSYKSADVATAHRMLRRFASEGAGIEIIDHVVKSADDRGRWAIGSERKLSGLDGSAIGFDVRKPFGRGLHGIARLTIVKDRPGYLRGVAVGGKTIGEFHLRPGNYIDGEPLVVAELRSPETSTEGAAFRPTQVMERAVVLLSENPEGMSKNAIRIALGGRKDIVDLALELLVGEGKVVPERGARGAIVHRITTGSSVA